MIHLNLALAPLDPPPLLLLLPDLAALLMLRALFSVAGREGAGIALSCSARGAWWMHNQTQFAFPNRRTTLKEEKLWKQVAEKGEGWMRCY